MHAHSMNTARGLALDLANRADGPVHDQLWRQLADELLRHTGPGWARRWVGPPGHETRAFPSAEEAVQAWIDDARARRDVRDRDALVAWWDALDVEGCGGDAVRVVAQDVRRLRDWPPGPGLAEAVTGAILTARSWGFTPPTLAGA